MPPRRAARGHGLHPSVESGRGKEPGCATHPTPRPSARNRTRADRKSIREVHRAALSVIGAIPQGIGSSPDPAHCLTTWNRCVRRRRCKEFLAPTICLFQTARTATLHYCQRKASVSDFFHCKRRYPFDSSLFANSRILSSGICRLSKFITVGNIPDSRAPWTI